MRARARVAHVFEHEGLSDVWFIESDASLELKKEVPGLREAIKLHHRLKRLKGISFRIAACLWDPVSSCRRFNGTKYLGRNSH